MKSISSSPALARLLLSTTFFLILAASANGQQLAVLDPDAQNSVPSFSDAIHSALATKIRVIDSSMANAAFASVHVDSPYNLSRTSAIQIAKVVGCRYFILLRSRVQRRESLDRPTYFEAFASVYVVNGKSGTLEKWLLKSFEAQDVKAAESKLLASSKALADDIADVILKSNDTASAPKPLIFPDIAAVEGSAPKAFKAPIPYRRIKPEYTAQAFLYGVAATVEIEVDIDAEGKIVQTSIARWAGFGLDESVEKTVREMNWRPASLDGKFLPTRVLLRYNFVKIEKDDAP